MRILTRYITHRLILYYFAFIIFMVVFFVFVDFMEHIEWITKEQAPIRLVALYYACLLPRLFIEMSWVSFLVAMLFVLGSLAKNNEFTAMLAGGISLYRVGVPVLVIGTSLTAAVFCVQEVVMPYAMLRAYQIQRNDFDHETPEESQISNIALIGKRNRFYFFDAMDTEQGIITGVHIHKRDGDTIVERIDADTALWDTAAARWFLKDGIARKFDSRGVITEIAPFSTMKAPFKESPRMLEVYTSRHGEFNFRQLRHQIKNLQRSGYDAKRLKVDYQMKFALPVANLIVVLLGLPFALECRRGGLTIGFALSLMTALLYYGTFQIGLALGHGGYVPAAVAAWLANILFFGIGATLTMRART